MDLQTGLLIIGVVILSIILIILLTVVAAILALRKKFKLLRVTRIGGFMTLLPMLKLLLGKHNQIRR